MENSNEQIFYDRKHLRWLYSRRIGFVLIVFLFAIFSVWTGSIIIRPVLPQLELKAPVSPYRGVPNVPKDPSAPVVQIDNNTAVLNIPQGTPSGITNPRVIAFYVNWDDNSLTSLKSNISKIDELMPEWLHLGSGQGEILIDDQDRQNMAMDFVKLARPNLPIAVLINNFNQDTQQWDADRLSAMLGDSQNRKATIDNLLTIVRQNNFKGVNIDFENVPDNQQQNLKLFMQELYAAFHPLGLEISESVPLDDNSFDLKTLAQSSDFLILMAYDENSLYDTLAGPIASQNWFASKLAVQMKQIDPAKLVVAVGSYGYDWLDQQKTGNEVDFQDAIRTAQESEGKIVLDKKNLNPNFDYYDENNQIHHVWFLDATTIFNEMVIGQKLGTPLGYALWRMGSEDPGIWNVFDNRTKLDSETAATLGTMNYGYDVTVEGNGEIFQVTKSPQTGQREITYDAPSGFVTGEKIITFPSSYVITEWGADNKNKLALTFDDGPDSVYTPKILDILKKYNVPAAFFVIGVNANANKGLLNRIVSEGHELGNHTYTHPNIAEISQNQFQFEVDATERLFEGTVGRKSLLFRPPYGEDIEPQTPDQVQPLSQTTNLGYYTIGMHIDPQDWSKPGTDSIVSQIMTSVQEGDGNIILLHDSGGNRQQTIDALPKIIEGLRSQGYQFVSVSDLMGLSRDQVMPPISFKEQLVAKLNLSAFTTLSFLNSFLYIMFITGIVLGFTRFVFIGILAVAQWFYARRGAFHSFLFEHEPSVDVIVPAFNEENVITKTVDAILHSSYQNYHVLVVDDGSTDRTYEIARAAYAQDNRVSVYTKQNGGKSDALNFGIVRSKGEIIVTLDADTLFKHDTIEKLVRRFVDRRVAAVAGNAKVGNRINLLTRWQALEYITSQNLDRRAFEIINCISVVPGAVGAWRRTAVLEAGGFSNSTLAEDADLTYAILKNGHQIAYDDEAIGYTEAPDSVKNFIKQRFRWMFGTLQTIWKHKNVMFHKKYGALGFFAIPNVLIFQVFFPLISPLMDLMLIFSIFWAYWQQKSNQIDYSSGSLHKIVIYYLIFTVIDLLTALIPFFLERKEDWKLIFWNPLQRFFYRQLIYYVAIKSVFTVIKGTFVSWGKFERKATVAEELEEV